jgi:hypothetical protein
MKNKQLGILLIIGMLATTMCGCTKNNKEFTKEDANLIEYIVKNTTVIDVIKSQVKH